MRKKIQISLSVPLIPWTLTLCGQKLMSSVAMKRSAVTRKHLIFKQPVNMDSSTAGWWGYKGQECWYASFIWIPVSCLLFFYLAVRDFTNWSLKCLMFKADALLIMVIMVGHIIRWFSPPLFSLSIVCHDCWCKMMWQINELSELSAWFAELDTVDRV